jgi:N-acetylneuraminate synthase
LELIIKIDGTLISLDSKPYVIAEMSGNHNGDINRAKTLIEAARWAGASAVKLQTYRADTITIKSDRPEFRIASGLWAGRTLYELYEEAHTPWEWHAELFNHARGLGITVFSSPFDETAVDFLESLGAPAYKIASAEIVDWGLIEKIASTGKPVILSSGMASDLELEEALNVLRSNGAGDCLLLHCISAYPTPVAEAQLSRIPYLSDRFGVQIGLSDHTMGATAAVAAVALGAVAVEKHFTLARADGGVDSAFSLEREELKDFCETLSGVHIAVHSDVHSRPASEEETRAFRRSLYFVRPLKAGQVVAPQDVKSIRPGLGLPPRHLREIVGRKVISDIPAGVPVEWSMIERG